MVKLPIVAKNKEPILAQMDTSRNLVDVRKLSVNHELMMDTNTSMQAMVLDPMRETGVPVSHLPLNMMTQTNSDIVNLKLGREIGSRRPSGELRYQDGVGPEDYQSESADEIATVHESHLPLNGKSIRKSQNLKESDSREQLLRLRKDDSSQPVS